MSIGIFLLIGITSDKERSLFYFLIAILFYLIINIKSINFEKGFYWILTVLFVINTSFLANVYLNLNYLFAYLLIFFLIRVCILFSLKRLPNKKRPSDFFKYYFHKPKLFLERKLSKTKLPDFFYYLHKSKSFLTNNNLFLIRYLLFDLCIGVSVLIVMMGHSYRIPLLYFLIVFLFYLIINTNITNIKRTCYLPLVILFVINISSLTGVTFFKFYQKEQLTNNQSKYQKYKIYSIKTKNKKHSFIIENKEGTDKILNGLRERYPDKTDVFEGIPYGPNSFFHRLADNNMYHIDLLNDAFLVFYNKLDKNDDRVLLLEYINPLPILLNLKPIQGAYHWFHLGFTFSKKTIHHFNKTFEESDFIYMPLFLFSNESILKCHFYKWNFSNKRFALSSIHKYGFLFATHQKIKEYNLENLEFPNPDKIKESCLVIENEQNEKEKNQRKNILTRLLQRFSL